MSRIALNILLLAAAVAWTLTPLVIYVAHRLGAVDQPGPRKIHQRPIPRIGGVAVFAGLVSALAYAAYATGFMDLLPSKGLYWGTVAAAATALFLLGLVDDLWGLTFKWKFAVQIVIATIVWLGGFRIEMLSYPFGHQSLDLGVLSLPVTLLWVVGITNAMNLIDGLDGLAVGTALISTTTVAVIAYYRDQVAVAAISVALVGSLLGFLRYNFSPARIFLGDSGSMLLGFILAVTSIHGSQKGPTVVAVLAPLLVLGLPILDTTLAVFRRLYRLGREGAGSDQRVHHFVLRNASRVFLPDQDHLHHRLLDVGLSQRGAVLTLYGVVLLLALAATVHVFNRGAWVALVLVGVLSATTLGLLLLTVIKRRQDRARDVMRRIEVPARPVSLAAMTPGERSSVAER